MASPDPYLGINLKDLTKRLLGDPSLAGTSGGLVDSVLSGTGTPTISAASTPAAGGSTPASSGGTSAPIDYLALINGDPLYRQSQADLSAQGISDAASRAAAIQRALIQYGVVPDFAGSAGKLGLTGEALGYLGTDVNDRTRQLAQANTQEGLSTFAQLMKAHRDAQARIKNNLAARGIIRSGATGVQLGEEGGRFKIAQNDATQHLLDYLSGAISAFTQSERARRQQLGQAAADAAQRQRDLLGTSGGAPTGGTTTSTPAQPTRTPGSPAPPLNVVSQNAQGAQLIAKADGTYYWKNPDGTTSRLFT